MAGKGIEVELSVYKVQTLVDNGIRVAFDLPETAISDAAAFMECKRTGKRLKAKFIVLPSLSNGKKETNKRTARNPFTVAGG